MNLDIKVKILSPGSDVEEIKGFTIVVDVFRAFTVFYSILIDERNGIKIEGFDYGNSPTELKKI